VSGTQHVCSVVGGKPGNNFVSGSEYIAESFHYSRSHLWRNWGILIGFMIFFLITYLAATTYISAAKSKGISPGSTYGIHCPELIIPSPRRSLGLPSGTPTSFQE
jgi:hypothetical protein